MDDQEQQGKMTNQNEDESQAQDDRDDVARLAPSANDYRAMAVGYGPPPDMVNRVMAVDYGPPPDMVNRAVFRGGPMSFQGQIGAPSPLLGGDTSSNRMAAPIYGPPVRWDQPPKPVVNSNDQRLPQNSERMGFIYGPPTMLDGANQTTSFRSEPEKTFQPQVDQPPLLIYGPPPFEKGVQPPKPVVIADAQRLPQDTGRMGFHDQPTTLEDVNRIASFDKDVNTCLQTVNPDRVVILTYTDGDGKVFERTLNRRSTQITIGRADKCDLTIHDSSVSRIHALVSYVDGKAFVRQLGEPTNGTKFNGLRLVQEQPVELTDGGRLICGRVLINVSIFG